MTQTNRLFFVRADNADGENLDLLVVAENKASAEASWRTHYGLDFESVPEWVGDVPGVVPVEGCDEGAIDWDAVRMD